MPHSSWAVDREVYQVYSRKDQRAGSDGEETSNNNGVNPWGGKGARAIMGLTIFSSNSHQQARLRLKLQRVSHHNQRTGGEDFHHCPAHPQNPPWNYGTAQVLGCICWSSKSENKVRIARIVCHTQMARSWTKYPEKTRAYTASTRADKGITRTCSDLTPTNGETKLRLKAAERLFIIIRPVVWIVVIIVQLVPPLASCTQGSIQMPTQWEKE